MLSIMRISSAAQAASYYNSPDKYYSKDGTDIGSEWGGKGAEELGLSGNVKPDDLIRLLEGRINDETHLGRTKASGVIDHAPGTDFTFSAPKSVSVLALVGGDERLVLAHQEAVRRAMAYLEKNHAMTRVSENGETRYHKVDNLLYASYTHTESRKNDPQLHTHNVVMNAVMDEFGQWRSLETLRMFEAKMMTGLIYRFELANLIKGLGYEISVTDREKGFFDVKGVSETLMDALSQRRKQLMEAANQRGLFDSKSMEKAALFSRDSKKTPDREMLKDVWDETAREHGADLDSIINAAKEKVDIQQENNKHDSPLNKGTDEVNTPVAEKSDDVVIPDKSIELENLSVNETGYVTGENPGLKLDDYLFSSTAESLVEDVRLAYQVLAESEAVFSNDAIYEEVMKLQMERDSSAGVSLEDIGEVIDGMVSSGELLPRMNGYTTPAAFETEKQTIIMMLNGQGQRPAIGAEDDIRRYIAEFEAEKSLSSGSPFQFSDDQKEAIIHVATSKDLVSGIQGFAGTGKTTLLQCLIRYAGEQGVKSIGLAPTGSATETLTTETGIEGSTVDSFLFNRKMDDVATNQLWIVDESSLGKQENKHKLLKHAERSGAKILLLGDTKQMESVEWGKAFSTLQDFGMQTSHVTSIVRQKNHELREAVYSSIERDWQSVFTMLGNNIREESIFDSYVKMSEEDRNNTLVVIPDNEGKGIFNRRVHEERVKKGEISAKEINLKTLVNANLNAAQRRDVRYYKSGDVIEFQREIDGYSAGSLWHITGKNKKNELELKNDAGEKRLFSPEKLPKDSKFSLDVFKRDTITVSVGEVLAVKKSRKTLGVKNGDELTVIHLDTESQKITLKKSDGKELVLNTRDWHNLDYNYAQTSFGAQGKTVNLVMAEMESWRKNLVNFRSFYVNISRARNQAIIFTDSVKKLKESLYKHSSDKTTSLDGVSSGDMKRAAERELLGRDYANLFADLEMVSRKLAERQGVFSHTDLLRETLKHSIGTYDLRDVEKGIAAMRSRGDLGLSRISHSGKRAEPHYTLPDNIKTEARIVRHMLQGRDRLPTIAGKMVIESYVAAHKEKVIAGEAAPLPPETQELITAILNQRDESVLVLGSDHSGHRDLMRDLGRRIAEHAGYKVRGFTTTTEGVKQLQEHFAHAQNIYAHIGRMEGHIATSKPMHSRKELWVVENASQIGAEDTFRLQQVARYAGARLVLVADRQENSLAWGSVPSLMRENGMHTVNVDQAIKSRNQSINLATDAIAKGKIDDALSQISSMIHSVDNPENAKEGRAARINILAEAWLHLPVADRAKTAVVVPNYFSRNRVDLRIRDGLKQEGKLKGKSIQTTLYRNANLDPIEKRMAKSYQPGQVIEFESARNGAEKGEYFTIEAVNKQKNEITIKNVQGKTITMNVKDIAGSRGNSIRVYHVDEKEIAVGEQVRFNRTATKERLVNGDKNVPTKMEGVVERIDGKNITMLMHNSRRVTVNTDTWKHMEWGYTQNLYDIKDKRFENVITLMESKSSHFATQAALHNVLTKSTLNLRIITDNKGKLMDSLKHNDGFQRSALGAKKVAIDKSELDKFDRTYGLGLSPVNRGLNRLEAAFDRAVKLTQSKIAEKIQQKTVQRENQRSL